MGMKAWYGVVAILALVTLNGCGNDSRAAGVNPLLESEPTVGQGITVAPGFVAPGHWGEVGLRFAEQHARHRLLPCISDVW